MVNVSTWVSIQPKTNERLDRITAFKGHQSPLKSESQKPVRHQHDRISSWGELSLVVTIENSWSTLRVADLSA